MMDSGEIPEVPVFVDSLLAVKGKVKKIFLVRGEQRQAEALREKMQQAGLENIYYPYLRQTMEI